MALVGSCPSTGVGKDPKLSETHYLLGADYLKKKLPSAAKAELLRAIELDEENQDAHQLLGVIFFLEGMHKLNLLDRTQCLTGIAAQEQTRAANEEFRRCEKYLVTAVTLAEKQKKTESDALNYLANVSLHFKRYDEALGRAQKALSNILYAARHLALGTLGWAYYQKGDKVSAARELRQAVFHEPKFCVGRFRLARVYFEQGEHEKAIEELKQVTEDKECPIQEAHHLLGLIYTKKHDAEGARSAFDACVRMNPKSCISEECRRYAKLI